MSFFLRQKKKSHIIIDLGSHSIKAAIFEKPSTGVVPNNMRKVVKRLNAADQGDRLSDSLHEMLAVLLKEQANTPEKIIIGVGPNIATTSLQEWKIDSLHLRESLTQAHFQKYFQDLFNTHRTGTRAMLGYPVAIEINGYPATISLLAGHNPSLIKEITLRTIMLEFMDKAGSAFGELKKMFSGVEIEFIPLQGPVAEVLSSVCGIENAILVDVGASSTALMMIRDGRLLQLSSFLIGSDRFSHHIVKTAGGTFAEAEDVTRQYSQGLVSKNEQAEFSHIFSEEAGEWKKECIKALESCYPVAPLPQDFYLFRGGSYLPEIRSSLWSRDILKNFSAFESPRVHIVQASQIFNNDSLNGLIAGPEDVGLASLMHYSLSHKPIF